MEMKGAPPADPIFGEGVGVGLRKEDTELQAKLNAGIKALLDSGEYDRIAKKYFDFDIYGPRS
jgi:polar amino acid transport system substrate-binding protein